MAREDTVSYLASRPDAEVPVSISVYYEEPDRSVGIEGGYIVGDAIVTEDIRDEETDAMLYYEGQEISLSGREEKHVLDIVKEREERSRQPNPVRSSTADLIRKLRF